MNINIFFLKNFFKIKHNLNLTDSGTKKVIFLNNSYHKDVFFKKEIPFQSLKKLFLKIEKKKLFLKKFNTR